jgi:hypothetical protein
MRSKKERWILGRRVGKAHRLACRLILAPALVLLAQGSVCPGNAEVRMERWAQAAAAGVQRDSGGTVQALGTVAQSGPVGARSAAGAPRIDIEDGYWPGAMRWALVPAPGAAGLVLLIAAGALLGGRRRRKARMWAAAAWLAAAAAAPAVLAMPPWMTHQGRVLVDGYGPSGTGHFKFALLDETDGVLWTNDGMLPEPTAFVALPMIDGHFFAYLGREPEMTALPVGLLAGHELRLRVWFSSDGVEAALLEPDLAFGSVPHAFEALQAGDAQRLGGLTASGFWKLGGNGGTSAGAHFVGTTDNAALELKVNGARALRLEPDAASPNLVGGFSGNAVTAGAHGATIDGGGSIGYLNLVTDSFGTVGGGKRNQAGDGAGTTEDRLYATVGGGWYNTASGASSTIAGGRSNTASGRESTVAGGDANRATDTWAAVGGGFDNRAEGEGATIGGGRNNRITADFGTIAGGGAIDPFMGLLGNSVTDRHGTVGGGEENRAGDAAGTTADRPYATVGGGVLNTASGSNSTVGGGSSNLASGSSSTVGGGYDNEASGTYATTPGGLQNVAAGSYSFASGSNAKIAAGHPGSFLFGDSASAAFNSSAANEFAVRSRGGARFVLAIDGSGNPTWTCSVANGGSWSCSSDRNLKENLVPVDGRDVLERLSEVQVFRWNAKGRDPAVQHLGPMAQDFHAAFGLGEDDRHLSTIDLDGVALAAIQGLHRLVEDKEARIAALERQNAGLQARIEALERQAAERVQGPGAAARPSSAP